MVPALANVRPVQAAPRPGGQVLLHAGGEAVAGLRHAGGGRRVQAGPLHRGEAPAHLPPGTHVHWLGLAHRLHLQARPKLTLLMEEYFESFRIIINIHFSQVA